jgi:hypothetical protein
MRRITRPGILPCIRDRGLSRRTFLGAACAIYGALALAPTVVSNERLMPQDASAARQQLTVKGETAEAVGRRCWSYVQVLADDSMEGRKAGSEGHRRAARYVAQHFREAGLEPLANRSYEQIVGLELRQVREEQSRVDLIRQGSVEPLTLGEDVVFNLRGNNERTLDAPLIFLGYGLQTPDRSVDDLAGLDLNGKVVVAFNATPKGLPGALRAHFGSPAERWKAYKAAGARGVILILNPFSMDVPWKRLALRRTDPFVALADRSLDDYPGQELSMTLNPEHADRLFANSGYSFNEILKAVRDGLPLPRFDLPVRIRASADLQITKTDSQNVVAVIPGSDRKLRKEYVVVSAHLDHLGVFGTEEDRIYNGAMDNAMGIAALMEIANQVRARQLRPRRSIILLAVTAEEFGLLGSHYFVAVSRRLPIVANVNTDLFLPISPLKALMVFGLDESSLGDDLRAVATQAGLQVQPDPQPQRFRFIRSDQYSFIRGGIPSIAFKNGIAEGSPEEAIEKQWFAQRYHAPADDLGQPVDFAAVGKYAEVLHEVVFRVANQDESPEWKETSFFKTLKRH